MRRTYNLARGSQVPARLLNGLQDEQLGLVAASDQANGATALALDGADGRWWTTPDAGIADGTLRVIDASVDWRTRRLWGVYRSLGAAARRPGQSDDHVPNDPTAAPNTRAFHGWTGAGGLGAAAATVANGTPPTIADDQYAVLVDELATTADRVWLYARPSDGALCIYNDAGATLHAELLVWGAAAAPTLADPPSAYPAPIYVLWLAPGLAADRPTTPDPVEQIALYRATDTGAVTLWDGGAWRTLGTPSPTTTRGDMVRRGATADERFGLGPRGYVLRAGATDPGWAALQVSDSSVPTAGSDYAGVVYWRTDLGAHWMCTKGGAANTHAWRVLSLFDGDVAGAPTSDATWTTVASTTIPTDTVALLAVEVVGVKSDGSDALTASGRAGWANASGALVEIEPLTLLIGDDTRVRLDPSGTTLRAQVKGVVSEDWTWRVSLTRRLEVTP